MTKMYTEVASRYDHITLILPPEQNIDVKKAQGHGSYKGTVLTFKDKDGDVESAKMAQAWLDNRYQEGLKAFIAGMTVGGKYTIIKTKVVDMTKEDYEALADKKGVGNWGVKQILDGHVIPDGMGRPAAPAARTGGSGQTYGKRDNTGVETGHALNGAMRFLGGKATLEDIVTTAKTVHDITSQMKKEHAAANPDMSEYDCGAAVGNAVLNALEIAAARKKTLAYVPGIAKKWLAEAVPAIVAHIKPPKVEEKAPEPTPEPEVNEPMADSNDSSVDDDIPF